MGCYDAYNATDMPESGADQRADGGHKDRSLAIDSAQLLESAYGIKGSFGGSWVTTAQMCETECTVLRERDNRS